MSAAVTAERCPISAGAGLHWWDVSAPICQREYPREAYLPDSAGLDRRIPVHTLHGHGGHSRNHTHCTLQRTHSRLQNLQESTGNLQEPTGSRRPCRRDWRRSYRDHDRHTTAAAAGGAAGTMAALKAADRLRNRNRSCCGTAVVSASSISGGATASARKSTAPERPSEPPHGHREQRM